jgi:winged helix DNA-binding protein
VLSERALNRALLARQLLLERSTDWIVDAIEQVGGLQTQYAPSGYVGLWTRVAGFERDALTRALDDRSLIQASLMRTTLHLVTRREYWLFANGVRRSRQEWAARIGVLPPDRKLATNAERLREALLDGPKTVKELGDLAKGFVGTLGLWVDLVRVPPSGTWERRRADRLALAEDWVGPNDSTEAEGLEHVVRAYLRAFGPATWKDIGSWSGLSVADAKRGGEGLALATYRDERRGEPRGPRGRTASRKDDRGARPIPAPLGREPAGARPKNWSAARGPSITGVLDEEPVLGRGVPARRARGRRLVARG